MTKIRLKLYVIGQSSLSKRAIKNLELICSGANLEGSCEIEVIDLCKNEGVAEEEKILATPLLVKKAPPPQRRIIGDLSNHQKVLSTLEMANTLYE